jgi:hypothetical protein
MRPGSPFPNVGRDPGISGDRIMPESKEKIQKRGAERLSKLRAADRDSLNETEWGHRVTDSADYNGTQTIPGNSGDYEITTDYRRLPKKESY